MRDDRLLEMRVLRAVVEASGFTNAAYALGVSQSFVSQQVRSLEQRLGAKLLHRSTRGHRLTQEGTRFLDAAIRAIAAADEADAEILVARGSIGGELRISAPLAFGLDRLVPLIPDFNKAHPNIALNITLDDENSDLIGDVIDVAIRMGRLDDSSLVSRKLCSLQRIVVASPAFVAASGRPKVPDELTSHRCLLWSGARAHLNRWPFETDGKRHFVTVAGPIRTSNGPTLFQLCKDGLGVMRAAEHLARPAIERGELVELLEEFRATDETDFHLVYLPDRNLVPRIRLFLDFLIERFAVPDWTTLSGSRK